MLSEHLVAGLYYSTIVWDEVNTLSKFARINHIASDMDRQSVRLLVPTLYKAISSCTIR
jgi:hypothetical protein